MGHAVWSLGYFQTYLQIFTFVKQSFPFFDEFRSGILVPAKKLPSLLMNHLTSFLINGILTFSPVRAPTTISKLPSSKIWTNSGIRSLGYVPSASVMIPLKPVCPVIGRNSKRLYKIE